MQDPIYAAFEEARIDSDEADRAERIAADVYGMDSPEYSQASEDREKAFALFISARDEWEAAQVNDPLDDFNYVGSRHHY
jgi:hypothetical protein